MPQARTNCKHWKATQSRTGGACALGLFGGRPSHGVCRACPDYDGPPRGAGDLVAAVTHAVGIRPCGGCQKRRQRLNAAIPMG